MPKILKRLWESILFCNHGAPFSKVRSMQSGVGLLAGGSVGITGFNVGCAVVAIEVVSSSIEKAK